MGWLPSIVSLSLSLLGTSAWATQPDPAKTPGVLCTPNDPDFSGYRYAGHVAYCTRNVSYDEKVKVAQMYGIADSDWPKYEFDHLIPLNSGGSNDLHNLWPQPLAEAHLKDAIEQQTFNGLNSGTLNQDQAVQMIWDWIHAH